MGNSKSSFAKKELNKCAAAVSKWPEWKIQWEFRLLHLILWKMTQQLAADVKLPCLEDAVHQHEHGITSIPAQGIVITRPGTYTLQNDVIWTPEADVDDDAEQDSAVTVHAAIAITCSNVTLNLNGHRVMCGAKDSSQMHCIGVAALPAETASETLHDIHIRNGSVDNFHSYGVLVVAAEKVSLTDVTVSGLRNKDRHHGSVGTLVAACHDVDITGGGCSGTAVHSNAHSAIQLRFCENVRISGTAVTSQHNQSGGNVGMAVVGCRDVVVNAVTVTNLTVGSDLAPDSPGNTCLGVFLYLSTAVKLAGASITGVHGSCDDSHGISVFVCPQHVNVASCTVTDVSTGFNTEYNSGAKATGVEVMVATDVHVKGCTATNVRASIPQDRQVAGFSSGFTWRVTFENCVAKNVSIALPAHTSSRVLAQYTAAGFGWAPDPRRVFIRPSIDTEFLNCFSENADVAFDDFMHHNARFKGCGYKNCKHALRNPGADASRVMACDKCSECVPAVVKEVGNDRHGTKGTPKPKETTTLG